MEVSNGGTGGDETVCSLRRGCREKKKKKTTYERRDSSLSHTSQCTYLEADEDRNKPRNGHESRGPSKEKKIVGHFLFNGLCRSELRYLYCTAKIDSAKCYDFCEKMPGRQSLLRVYGRYNYILFFLFLICTAQPTLSVAQFTKVHCKRTGQEKQERSTYRSATLRVAFSLFFSLLRVLLLLLYIYICRFVFFILLFLSNGYEKLFA